MKALIIIAVCLTLALVLRIFEILTSRQNINSVGGKANRNSRNMWLPIRQTYRRRGSEESP